MISLRYGTTKEAFSDGNTIQQAERGRSLQGNHFLVDYLAAEVFPPLNSGHYQSGKAKIISSELMKSSTYVTIYTLQYQYNNVVCIYILKLQSSTSRRQIDSSVHTFDDH